MNGYIYQQSEPGPWTVGAYSPKGTWHPDGDYSDRAAAAERVHYLNGGTTDPHKGQRIELVRLLSEAVAHLATVAEGEHDDPAVGITGWDDCHRVIHEARCLLAEMTNIAPELRCYACGKKMENGIGVFTADQQKQYVGPECHARIFRAGPEGYQPPRGGPRLFPYKPKEIA